MSTTASLGSWLSCHALLRWCGQRQMAATRRIGRRRVRALARGGDVGGRVPTSNGERGKTSQVVSRGGLLAGDSSLAARRLRRTASLLTCEAARGLPSRGRDRWPWYWAGLDLGPRTPSQLSPLAAKTATQGGQNRGWSSSHHLGLGSSPVRSPGVMILETRPHRSDLSGEEKGRRSLR